MIREASCLLHRKASPFDSVPVDAKKENVSKSMEKYRGNHNNGSYAVWLLDKQLAIEAWWINCPFFFGCCKLAEVIEGIITNTTKVTLIQIGFPIGLHGSSMAAH